MVSADHLPRYSVALACRSHFSNVTGPLPLMLQLVQGSILGLYTSSATSSLQIVSEEA